ncbi:MAG: ParE toxin of type toxin-antitoxin system, parDE [Bacteroidota bacterium]|jgi:plasmid stabilization system protein ParE
MEKRQRAVKILPRFIASVNHFQDYIFESSPQNAVAFADDLFSEIELISQFPFIYKEFKYLKTKQKLYRYKIYKTNFFIVFKLTETSIIFIEVTDGRMSKSKYKKLRVK